MNNKANIIWKYYKKNIEFSRINFINEDIICLEKNFKTGKLENEVKYKEIDNYILRAKYGMNLDEVKEIYTSYSMSKASSDLFELSPRLIFMKDKALNSKYCSNYNDLELWCQIKKEPSITDFITYQGNIIAFLCPNGSGTEYLIKEGYEYLTPLEEWKNQKLSNSGRGFYKINEYYVEMRDAIKLATDVWLPADYKTGERLPTILIRTCYDKKRSENYHNIFADRGYAVVIQDVRGREKSEGKFIGMYYEKNDGNDTLNWIAKQEWSNGNIGMIGGSYLGYVQWAAAASGNEHLKAIVSQVAAGSPFHDVERRGGGYNMYIMQWNIMMSEKQMVQNLDKIDWKTELKKRPIKDIPKNITGKNLEFWDLYMEHPDYDKFWKEMAFSDESYNVNVPALVISGWHDGDLNGTIEVWEMIKRNGIKNCKLLLGPWEHAFNNRRYVGEYSLSADSIIYNIDILYIKWFDRYLKGIENEVDSIKNRYYIEGLNKWRESSTWPPEDYEKKSFYLFADRNKKGKLLTQDEIAKEEKTLNYLEYEYDPEKPQLQLHDNITKKSFTPVDYSELEKEDDILLYTSDKFKIDTIIGGQSEVILYASSSAVDTDWLVRLTVVTEEGKSYRITDNLIRAKYRKSYSKPELLEQNKMEKYIIKLPYCAQLIKKGERIRLQITSSQFGQMFPNSNTGNDPAYDTECVVAKQRIYHDDKYRSVLLFKTIEIK